MTYCAISGPARREILQGSACRGAAAAAREGYRDGCGEGEQGEDGWEAGLEEGAGAAAGDGWRRRAGRLGAVAAGVVLAGVGAKAFRSQACLVEPPRRNRAIRRAYVRVATYLRTSFHRRSARLSVSEGENKPVHHSALLCAHAALARTALRSLLPC